MNQQKPFFQAKGIEVVVDLNLGSQFAKKLGLGDIKEWDASTATTVSESSIDGSSDGLPVVVPGISEPSASGGGDGPSGRGKTKKKNNKKKKK
jgi:hypothetical protein